MELTYTQLNKLESAAKNKTAETLKITKKNFQDKEIPHEAFLTTKQKTKIRNVSANYMATDIKLSKAQLSKIIQSGEFLGKTFLWLKMFCLNQKLKKLFSAIDKFERTSSGKGVLRAVKGFALFI